MVRVLSNRDIIVCDKSVLPDDMGNDAAKYQVNNRAIILDSRRGISQQMNDVSHEMRHAYQDAVIPDFMPPRENNVQNLADLYSFEADAEAFSKIVAWELKIKGDPVAWQEAKKENIYMPIAAAVEQSLQNVGDRPTVNDYNLSLKRGFEGWVGSRDLRLQYFREGWNLNEGCILPSGPDALSGRILNIPGVDGKKPYINRDDVEKLQKIAISDAGALAQVAERTEGLSPAKKQRFRNSLTCR